MRNRLQLSLPVVAIWVATVLCGEMGAQEKKGWDFQLIDARRHQAIGPVADGDEIGERGAGKLLNLVAAYPGAVSVKLELTGPINNVRLENQAPFSLFGDIGKKFAGRRFSAGSYQLKTTAFSKPNGKGGQLAESTIAFSVSAQDAGLDWMDHGDFFPASFQALFPEAAKISGNLQQWETITFTVSGPEAAEDDALNPFTRRLFAMQFVHEASGEVVLVPGYFAADGKAADSSAMKGNRWRAHFVPGQTGKWRYEGSLVTRAEGGGEVVSTRGEFSVKPAAEGAKGMLRHPGDSRYLTWTGTGEIFLKGGADSPENFLAYADFDGTRDDGGHGKAGKAGFLHRYEPHVQDWKDGDPTWQDGKGKGIIGALNYLASNGMNSVYMLPFNVAGGDGKDTWPWTDAHVRDRFDVSKLDQWNRVFDHMDRRGLAIHIVLQEQENDQDLDGGDLGPERKLYLRELIARFAHHRAVFWNLGEENTNSTAQQKATADFIRQTDPYDHPVVVHTFPKDKEKVYRPLLGHPSLNGPSLQTGNAAETHAETLKWVRESEKSGRPWFVCHDEVGPASRGVDPDSRTADNNQPTILREALWGNLLAGGSGAEWYFGYQNPHSDLNCEDWRSRSNLWIETGMILKYFRQFPLADMACHDEMTDREDAWCFAKPGELYVIYVRNGTAPNIDLRSVKGRFLADFVDPFSAKRLEAYKRFDGGKRVELTHPDMGNRKRDTLVVIQRENQN